MWQRSPTSRRLSANSLEAVSVSEHGLESWTCQNVIMFGILVSEQDLEAPEQNYALHHGSVVTAHPLSLHVVNECHRASCRKGATRVIKTTVQHCTSLAIIAQAHPHKIHSRSLRLPAHGLFPLCRCSLRLPAQSMTYWQLGLSVLKHASHANNENA